MNSIEATERLIRAFLTAYDDRKLDVIVDSFDEDGELDISGSARVIGQQEIRFAMAERFKQFEESIGDIVILNDGNGMRGAAEFTLRGTYRADADYLPPAYGQSYSLAAGLFCEVEESKFTRISLRYNPMEQHRQVLES